MKGSSGITVSEIERYIKTRLANEDVCVSKTGFDSLEIIITDPTANIGYLFSCLVSQYGASITESAIGSGRGTYVVTLPEGVQNDRTELQQVSNSKPSVVTIITVLTVLMLAIALGRAGLLLNWNLIYADIGKDSIPN